MRTLIRASIVFLITSATASAQCPSALVNAASYATPLAGSSGIVPGEVVTLFGNKLGPVELTTFQLDPEGRLPATLAGTQVLFNGVPGPLLYVSATQVSAIVPYTVAASPQIEVVYQGVVGNCYIEPDVVASAPGIFTAAASGLDQAAAFNLDGSINGPDHPAAPGSVVSFYITGAGQTIPPLADGAIAMVAASLALPVTATIGGQLAPVLYAGAAPGIVAGVYQVNAMVPANLAYGGALPLTVQVNGVSAQTGVTVTVMGPAAPAPRVPEPGDLRFQGVDAAPHLTLLSICADVEVCELNYVQPNGAFSNAVSSSLMAFGDEWHYQVVQPIDATVPFGLTFQSGSLSDFQTQINAWTATPTTVVTSLDIEPAYQNEFAWSAMAGQGQFNLNYLSVAASDLQITASAEGAAGRVITALDYQIPGDDTGKISALSYGSQQDTTTVYDAMVSVTTDAGNVGNAATALAASGYIITAFGNNGLLMVGTRVKGDTLPRPLVVTDLGSASPMLLQGYTIVGYTPGGCILEK